MTEMALDYCQVVSESITGKRAVDEDTFVSLAVLTERLERLRKLAKMFENVKFSPHVKKLKSRENILPVS